MAVYALIQPNGQVWKKLSYREMAYDVAAAAPADVRPLEVKRVCDYCEEAPATGFVAAYQASVCRSCYEDHHGPIDSVEPGENEHDDGQS